MKEKKLLDLKDFWFCKDNSIGYNERIEKEVERTKGGKSILNDWTLRVRCGM